MQSVQGALATFVVGLVAAIACGKSAGSDDDDCPHGTERCPCDRNDACDRGLECRSGLCVAGDTGGTAGTGAVPSGGTGNASGAVGEGGRSGTATGGVATGGSSGQAGEGGEGASAPGGASADGGTAGSGMGGMSGRAGSGGTIGGSGSGGMTGGAGSGGMTGGSGGTMCGVVVAAPSETLIDDLEDGDNVIARPRVGYWYTFSDGSTNCRVTPPLDLTGADPFLPASGSGQGASLGARFSGSGCTTWGAGIGFDLNNCNLRSYAYNAQAFGGISFWYKSTTAVRLIIATLAVIPTTRGGTCVPGSGMGMECDNPHGADLPAAPAGTTASIAFTNLLQTFGQMRPFDKTELAMITWQVAPGLTFDFTIDNVAFVP